MQEISKTTEVRFMTHIVREAPTSVQQIGQWSERQFEFSSTLP